MDKKHRQIYYKWFTDSNSTAIQLQREHNPYCLKEQPTAILSHQQKLGCVDEHLPNAKGYRCCLCKDPAFHIAQVRLYWQELLSSSVLPLHLHCLITQVTAVDKNLQPQVHQTTQKPFKIMSMWMKIQTTQIKRYNKYWAKRTPLLKITNKHSHLPLLHCMSHYPLLRHAGEIQITCTLLSPHLKNYIDFFF